VKDRKERQRDASVDKSRNRIGRDVSFSFCTMCERR